MDPSASAEGTGLVGRTVVLLVLVFLTVPGVAVAAALPQPTPWQVRAAATNATPPTLVRQGLVVPAGPTAYDSLQAMNPSVLVENGMYRMWYGGCDPAYDCSIILATSSDGRHWTKDGVVLAPIGGNETIISWPSVVRVAGTYWMYYGGTDRIHNQVYAATSADGTTWVRRGRVLTNGTAGSDDAGGAYGPRVLFDNGVFRMWYTGITSSGSEANILVASSTDGLTWTKEGRVLGPGPPGSLDAYAVQTGSVVRIGTGYAMVYAGLTGPSSASLLYATSSNGTVWQKAGQLLGGIPGNETNLFQPDLLLLPNGQWDLYYVVRNDVSDLAIYLAIGNPAAQPGGGGAGSGESLSLSEFLVPAAFGVAGATVVIVALVLLSRESRRPRQ